MILILHPEARTEMVESAVHYASEVPDLGDDFLAAVDFAFDQILEAPDRWRIIGQNVRRYIMPRFPFGILYQMRNDHIQVVAIAHFSRHPDYWKHRTE